MEKDVVEERRRVAIRKQRESTEHAADWEGRSTRAYGTKSIASRPIDCIAPASSIRTTAIPCVSRNAPYRSGLAPLRTRPRRSLG